MLCSRVTITLNITHAPVREAELIGDQVSEIPSNHRLTWQWNWCYRGPGVLLSALVRIICQTMPCAVQGQLALSLPNSCWQQFWKTILPLWKNHQADVSAKPSPEEGMLLPVHVLGRDDGNTEARPFCRRCLLMFSCCLMVQVVRRFCLDWKPCRLLKNPSTCVSDGLSRENSISIQPKQWITFLMNSCYMMALLGCSEK